MRKMIKKLPFFNYINVKRKELISTYTSMKNYIYDFNRFNSNYTPEYEVNKDNEGYISWILQDKHRVEKGLSLPNPRANFGKDIIKRLVNNTIEYKKKYGKGHVYYISLGSLKAYVNFHKEKSITIDPDICNEIEKFDINDFDNEICETVGLKDRYVISDTSSYFSDFVSSRSTCRNFENTVVENEKIKQVMELAISAPSVCNRQHWKVHIFTGKTKDQLLSLQNGNAGFRDNIPYLAVVTSDIRAFYMPQERNQQYTDSGMFAMNFIYSLHAFGISSCALNWCVKPEVDKEALSVARIPNNESISMFIAFGYANENCLRAKSPRKNVTEFYSVEA